MKKSILFPHTTTAQYNFDITLDNIRKKDYFLKFYIYWNFSVIMGEGNILELIKGGYCYIY